MTQGSNSGSLVEKRKEFSYSSKALYDCMYSVFSSHAECSDLMFLLSSYQFLEDAYKYHKEHMESMTHQLQEKKKLIEDVSNSINTG